MPSNPSWGTGTISPWPETAPSSTFQPLMGNGNSYARVNKHGRRLTSNPSWGTGTFLPKDAAQAAEGFQPLMGNGNQQASSRPGSAYASSNPSWGTGIGRFCTAARLLSAFQPLMGNGNHRHVIAGSLAPTFFQPLMGNGNIAAGNGDAQSSRLPTPHGEREPSAQRIAARSPFSSNPSWGTGTVTCGAGGEVEPPSNPSWGTGTATASASASVTRSTIFQPLMGNGNQSPVL